MRPIYDTEFRTSKLTKEVKPPRDKPDDNIYPDPPSGWYILFIVGVFCFIGGLIGFVVGHTYGHDEGYDRGINWTTHCPRSIPAITAPASSAAD